MAPSGIDPELRRLVAEGRYVVDPRVVAEAILQRLRDRRLSRVLVAPELLNGRAVGVDEHDAGAGFDAP